MKKKENNINAKVEHEQKMLEQYFNSKGFNVSSKTINRHSYDITISNNNKFKATLHIEKEIKKSYMYDSFIEVMLNLLFIYPEDDCIVIQNIPPIKTNPKVAILDKDSITGVVIIIHNQKQYLEIQTQYEHIRFSLPDAPYFNGALAYHIYKHLKRKSAFDSFLS